MAQQGPGSRRPRDEPWAAPAPPDRQDYPNRLHRFERRAAPRL